eukprot:2150469-Pleurochrysis_carterae.AAC.1
MPGKIKLMLSRGIDVDGRACLGVLGALCPPAIKVASFALVLRAMLGLIRANARLSSYAQYT